MTTRHINLIASLALLLLLLVLGKPAQSYEVETGPVLICDTQEQVERFIQIYEGDQELAINTVNLEQHDASACAVVNAAYVLGPQLGVARGQSQAFEITGIAVIGLTTPEGYRPTTPSLYFTPVNLKEFAV
jgi:hypothetical protein